MLFPCSGRKAKYWTTSRRTSRPTQLPPTYCCFSSWLGLAQPIGGTPKLYILLEKEKLFDAWKNKRERKEEPAHYSCASARQLHLAPYNKFSFLYRFFFIFPSPTPLPLPLETSDVWDLHYVMFDNIYRFKIIHIIIIIYNVNYNLQSIVLFKNLNIKILILTS